MPQLTADPFYICPDPQLVTDHPELLRLAKQLSLEYAYARNVTDAQLQVVGQALWQVLAIDEAFKAAQQAAGLRILPLVIQTDNPALFALPWECLCHPEEGFLAQLPRYTLSRQWQTHSLAEVPSGPLQVLLFTAQPDDLDAETARLDIETEQAKVLEALLDAENAGQVQLTILDDGRLRTLQTALRDQTFHLVFLSGHGAFKAEAFSDDPAEAYFLFEGESGLGEQVAGPAIAELFYGTAVQCVVLSACQSGKVSSEDLNASLTTRLAQVGIPHVIGMRESVKDMAATVFTTQLCQALVQQECVEVAVQRARTTVTQTQFTGGLREVGFKEDISGGQWNLPHLISLQPLRPLLVWGAVSPPLPRAPLLVESLQNITLPQQFIGRRKELRELGSALVAGRLTRLLLTGAGGQGKTALAGQLARKLQARGYLVLAYSARPEDSDWQQFLFHVQVSLEPALAEWLDRQLAKCQTETQQAQVYLQVLLQQSQQKLLLFFDNLESVQTEAGVLTDARLAAWLTEAQRLGSPRLLLTSRWGLPGWQSPAHYVLPRPSYGDFLRYLQALDNERGQNPANVLRQSWAAKRELYQQLGGNFKGLQLYHAAERTVGFDRDGFLANVAAAQEGVQAYMAVQQVVGSLSGSERTLLERLTVYQTAVAVAGVSRISQDLSVVDGLLARLVALSLVDVARPAGAQEVEYQVTPLVAEWLACRAQLPLAVREQAAGYQQWVHDNLHYTIRQAIVTHEAMVFAELHAEAEQFAIDEIVGHLIHAGLAQRALQEWLPALRESDTQAIKAGAFGYSGQASHAIGDYETALGYLKQSLAIAQEIGDRSGEGTTLNNISQIFKAQGDYETALEYLKQSLAIQQAIGDRSGEGTTLNNISQIYDAQGDYETALGYLKQSLAIRQAIGDRSGEGTTLNNMSTIAYAQGDYETALGYLKQSLAIAQEIGDRRNEGGLLNNISQIYDAQGDYETALRYLKQSLAITQAIGDRSGEGTTLNNISQIFQAQGDYETALGYLKQSLAIRQAIGDRSGEGTTLNNISQIYDAQGDYETALGYLKQSLAIQQAIGDVAGMCATLFNIGHIHWENEEQQDAVSAWVHVYLIAKKMGHAQALQALEGLAKDLGGTGLDTWETLARQLEQN